MGKSTRQSIVLSVILLLAAFSLTAAQKKPADPKCALCGCELPYSKCDKDHCTVKHRKEDTCEMQCKDSCMHQKGGAYCPKKQPSKT